MAFKIAFVGLDHVHLNQMAHSFIHSGEDYEFLGAADFLSEDKDEIDRKFHNNTAPNIRETLTLFYELDELLSLGPDLVVVNSDVKSHADCVCMLLERDFNVLVEKPMAFDFEDAKRMYRAAKKSSGELIINWPIAWFPAFNKAKELADSGTVGEVLRVQYRSPSTRGPYRLDQFTPRQLSEMWWYKSDRGGGSIFDYAGYGCVLTTWITGKNAKRVSGIKKNFFLPFSDVEDYSCFTIDFGDAVGLIEGSWSTMNNGQIATGPVVYGREGVIVADRFDPVVKVYKDLKPYQPSPAPTEEFSLPPQDNSLMAKNVIAHFKDGAPLHELLTLDFNMRAASALDAGVRSCNSGNTESAADPLGL